MADESSISSQNFFGARRKCFNQCCNDYPIDHHAVNLKARQNCWQLLRRAEDFLLLNGATALHRISESTPAIRTLPSAISCTDRRKRSPIALTPTRRMVSTGLVAYNVRYNNCLS